MFRESFMLRKVPLGVARFSVFMCFTKVFNFRRIFAGFSCVSSIFQFVHSYTSLLPPLFFSPFVMFFNLLPGSFPIATTPKAQNLEQDRRSLLSLAEEKGAKDKEMTRFWKEKIKREIVRQR